MKRDKKKIYKIRVKYMAVAMRKCKNLSEFSTYQYLTNKTCTSGTGTYLYLCHEYNSQLFLKSAMRDTYIKMKIEKGGG
jgi:hypothetical protein